MEDVSVKAVHFPKEPYNSANEAEPGVSQDASELRGSPRRRIDDHARGSESLSSACTVPLLRKARHHADEEGEVEHSLVRGSHSAFLAQPVSSAYGVSYLPNIRAELAITRFVICWATVATVGLLTPLVVSRMCPCFLSNLGQYHCHSYSMPACSPQEYTRTGLLISSISYNRE